MKRSAIREGAFYQGKHERLIRRVLTIENADTDYRRTVFYESYIQDYVHISTCHLVAFANWATKEITPDGKIKKLAESTNNYECAKLIKAAGITSATAGQVAALLLKGMRGGMH